jgi:hypothetical protein
VRKERAGIRKQRSSENALKASCAYVLVFNKYREYVKNKLCKTIITLAVFLPLPLKNSPLFIKGRQAKPDGVFNTAGLRNLPNVINDKIAARGPQ